MVRVGITADGCELVAGPKLSFNSANLDKALSKLADKIGNGGSVQVGIIDSSDYPVKVNGKIVTVPQVAFWMEFGTKYVKARPFIRTTINEIADTIGDRVAKTLKATDYDIKVTLNLVGIALKDRMTRTIARWPADNSETWARIKGFNHGLIHTGVLQRKIDYRVETGRSLLGQ
jgi:hypothetical protein